MANIGFIGLGDMGQVIIPRLIESGHKVVGWIEHLENQKIGINWDGAR